MIVWHVHVGGGGGVNEIIPDPSPLINQCMCTFFRTETVVAVLAHSMSYMR